MRTILLLSLLLLSTLAVPQGMPPKDEKVIAAMKELAFLVGEWEGEGWQMVGSTRRTSKVHEKVIYKAGNTVVSVEGLGKDETGKVTHNAFGILYYDSASKEYRLRSFLEQGTNGEFKATAKGGVVTWTMQAERTIRYTVKLDSEGRWHEVGEVDMGDGKWFMFMEMKLKRVKA